jgi:uncharacterized protein
LHIFDLVVPDWNALDERGNFEMKTQTNCDQSRSVKLDLIQPAIRFRQRTIGLLGRAALAPGHGIWLAPCWAIHTVGMRFPIDLVFIARSGAIVRIDQSVAPGRMRCCWRAWSIIEMSAGWASELGLKQGVVLSYPADIVAVVQTEGIQ